MLKKVTNEIKSGFWGFLSFISFSLEVFFKFASFYKETNVSSLVLLRQILFTGYEALGLILVLATALGGLLIGQFGSLLINLGQSQLFFGILVKAITCELSSVLTAFLIVARSGTAIATEIANMKVNQEIELIDSIGISPISYLIIPRLVGVTVSCVVLTIYFNVATYIGGWLIANLMHPYPFSSFLYSLFKALTISDFAQSILKSLVFGILISLISSYQAFQVDKAITQVPQRTIKAVVYCISTIIVVDLLISVSFALF